MSTDVKKPYGPFDTLTAAFVCKKILKFAENSLFITFKTFFLRASSYYLKMQKFDSNLWSTKISDQNLT